MQAIRFAIHEETDGKRARGRIVYPQALRLRRVTQLATATNNRHRHCCIFGFTVHLIIRGVRPGGFRTDEMLRGGLFRVVSLNTLRRAGGRETLRLILIGSEVLCESVDLS